MTMRITCTTGALQWPSSWSAMRPTTSTSSRKSSSSGRVSSQGPLSLSRTRHPGVGETSVPVSSTSSASSPDPTGVVDEVSTGGGPEYGGIRTTPLSWSARSPVAPSPLLHAVTSASGTESAAEAKPSLLVEGRGRVYVQGWRWSTLPVKALTAGTRCRAQGGFGAVGRARRTAWNRPGSAACRQARVPSSLARSGSPR